MKPLVEMIDIVKVYPDGVKALDGVTLRLYPGRIHAVLGENGAGKTTLMRILYGEIRPTRGVLLLEGRPVKFRGTMDAIRSGIAMIYQHPRLVPTLTVWENMILYFRSAGIPRGEVGERLERAGRLTGFEVPLDERVENLPLGARQRAEILRSIAAGARILVLDEPTTNLAPQEFEGLAKALNSVKREGLAVVYITHRLPEVRVVADTVTVLRRGKVMASELDPSRVSDEELAKLMVGDLPPRPPGRRRSPGQPVLLIENLRVEGRVRVQVDRLEVRAGEIVGLAGVEGNGQEELVGAIVGYTPRVGGRVVVLGKENPTPREYYKAGAAYIPGDRSEALTPSLSVAENLAFLRYAHGGPVILSFARLSRLFEEVAREYSIMAESPWTPAGSLSGGNQQKLLVASQLHMRPRLLLAVNPTRGLDVATTRYVRRLIAGLAEEGAGVLLVSSDLDEILEVSDRIAVISRGRITGILPASEATPERVGLLMGGAS